VGMPVPARPGGKRGTRARSEKTGDASVSYACETAHRASNEGEPDSVPVGAGVVLEEIHIREGPAGSRLRVVAVTSVATPAAKVQSLQQDTGHALVHWPAAQCQRVCVRQVNMSHPMAKVVRNHIRIVGTPAACGVSNKQRRPEVQCACC